MKNILQYILTSILVLPGFIMLGQYNDYIGAGHSEGITVTSSSQFENTQAINTLNGSGLFAARAEAGRFLNQASFGPTMEEIDHVREIGFENWIEEQFNMPSSEYQLLAEDIWDEYLTGYINMGYTEDDIYGPWYKHFSYAWWTNVVQEQDQLRQRIAYALSQIFVISINSDLQDHGIEIAAYYDYLAKHSFGNFRDLLFDVTMNPNMGYYLSHLNNPKEVPEENIHPDENYAREIMQLFTIGLYELNLDGTRKKDANGNDIPTYDNNDIKQFARVFTGLGMSAIKDNVDWVDEAYFGLGIYGGDMTYQMRMYDDFHERGTKELLNGYVIPADQEPMQDIHDAIDHLFNHENVGPFIGHQMIQRLVKSNPSPAYISRVASAFNNNGNGVRGDMKAVIKAVLLDEEARTCYGLDNLNEGKVKEPMLRYTHYIRTTPFDNPLDKYWNPSLNFYNDVEQMVLGAPTVFNFYLPDHQPVGELTQANLVAPELSIHNTRTSINYLNQINQWTVWGAPWWSWDSELGIETIRINYEGYPEEYVNPERVIHDFDLIYTSGQMTDETRNNLREQVYQLYWGDGEDDWMYRIMMAHYLTLISPDFVTQK